MLALLPLSKCVLWRQWSLQFFRTRWQLLQYPWVGRQQNFGYKQEVAAWDDPPSMTTMTTTRMMTRRPSK